MSQELAALKAVFSMAKGTQLKKIMLNKTG